MMNTVQITKEAQNSCRAQILYETSSAKVANHKFDIVIVSSCLNFPHNSKAHNNYKRTSLIFTTAYETLWLGGINKWLI